MESYILIIGFLVIIGILSFVLYIARKKIIEKRKSTEGIPEDVMKDFLLAENILKESKGEKNPHEILWEIANHRVNNIELKGGNENGNINTRTDTNSNTEQSGNEGSDNARQLEGRSDIPQSTINDDAGNSDTTRTAEPIS